MLRLVLKKVSSLSLIATFALVLFTLDTDSRSLISEAQACDGELFIACYNSCVMQCPIFYPPESWDWCAHSICEPNCMAAAGC